MYESSNSGKFTAAELQRIRDLGEGFLERYVTYASGLTDAPFEFHCACALGLMSSVVGQAGVEPLLGSRPNLWIVLLGPTTIYRKTTSLRIARKMLVSVDPDFLVATDFSPQALISEFGDRAGRSSVLFRDEVSGFFKSLIRHDFMAGTKELLIKLFDGDDFKRKLRKEEINVKDPYFVWVCGAVTEKLLDSVTEEDIFSGLMIRFLFVNPESRGPIRPLAYESGLVDWEREDLTAILKATQRRLNTQWTLSMGPALIIGEAPYYFVMDDTALRRFNKFVRVLETDFSGDPVVERINSRIGPLALKLMVLFAIDSWDRVRVALNTIWVGEDVLLKALFWAEHFRMHAVRTLVGVGRTQRERLSTRFVNYVGKNPGIRRGKLMRRFKLTAKEMSALRDTLRERELIRVEKSVTKGRSAELYFAKGETK